MNEQDTEGWMVFLADALGWSREQITVFAAAYLREIRNPKHHGYYLQKVMWAKKPE